jgi:hypothetical protein
MPASPANLAISHDFISCPMHEQSTAACEGDLRAVLASRDEGGEQATVGSIEAAADRVRDPVRYTADE